MAIVNPTTVILWDVNSPKINHFGTKPMVGGSPPREKSRMGKEIKTALFLAQEIANELIVFPPVIRSMENMQ